MAAKPKLKPCPFCGGSDIQVFVNSAMFSDRHVGFIVECASCKATTKTSSKRKSDAHTSWNKRA